MHGPWSYDRRGSSVERIECPPRSLHGIRRPRRTLLCWAWRWPLRWSGRRCICWPRRGFICGSRRRALCRAVWRHLSRTGGRLIHRPGRRNVFGAGRRNLSRTAISRSCRQRVIGSISQRRSKQIASVLMTGLSFCARDTHRAGWYVFAMVFAFLSASTPWSPEISGVALAFLIAPPAASSRYLAGRR
jgi:hypothetical protein